MQDAGRHSCSLQTVDLIHKPPQYNLLTNELMNCYRKLPPMAS